MTNKASAVPIILTILLVISLCCLCVCLVLFASGTILYKWQDNLQSTITVEEQPPAVIDVQPEYADDPITTEEPDIPTEPDTFPLPADPITITGAQGNLLTLQEEVVPINDFNHPCRTIRWKVEYP